MVKSTVFYNGCCRRRNSPCGLNSKGYLGQVAGNPKYGRCIEEQKIFVNPFSPPIGVGTAFENPITKPIADFLTGGRQEQIRPKPGAPKSFEDLGKAVRDFGKGTPLDVESVFTKAPDILLGTGAKGSGTIPGGVLDRDTGGTQDGDPNDKGECAKECNQLDLLCLSAKIQAGCGGAGCFGMGLPNLIPMMGESGCYIIPGIIGIILLLVFMRMR